MDGMKGDGNKAENVKPRETVAENPHMMEEALHYFKRITSRVSLKGNNLLIQHLTTIESIGLKRGIPADGVDLLLRLALSGNLVDPVNTRILKCLIPATELHPDSIIAAVSLFCTGKSSTSTRILFIRWLLSVFDLIPCKDALSSLYNFFFCLLLDDKLCPSLCHLLYLLTRKEHVKAYRVRSLLELQSRKGLHSHILGLLSIYKVFCPELVSLTLPSRVKMYFKESNLLFTSELKAIAKINSGDPVRDYKLYVGETKKPPSRAVKRKWNSNPYVPVSSRTVWSSDSNSLASSYTTPMERIQTFSQLLENILRLELPAQMGCVIQSPILLNFINCINEDDSLLRLNYWLAFTLHEECAWYSGQKRDKQEVEAFLNTIIRTQEFLQEGLSGTEEFLYKCLPRWNGKYCTQILQLISWIPLYSFPDIEGLLFETLMQLFVSSSLSFKIDMLKALKKLLLNWLLKHSVCPDHGSADQNDTLSGLMTSMDEMIQFTGRLCSLGIQMHNSPLLLHIILDFYKLVSDIYLWFNLPLIILPPPAVFYAALLCTDSANLNQLCYIMHRYRNNLLTAKRNEKRKTNQVPLNISSQTYQVYNQYLTAMVGCLWTSQAFSSDSHPQGIKMAPELLVKTGVLTYKKAFNIVFHPALMSFAVTFLKDRLSEDKMFDLHLLKGQYWDAYLEFLYSEGMTDLKLFLENSVNRVSSKKREEQEHQV
ncbi:centromere protein I [Bufo bufo]|uniref:centromere protein I n=1 Tax=Bufo bufo TaxID=8384 RepID=UPI001ABE62F3|nr:centromere protein I [Bufo bufo]